MNYNSFMKKSLPAFFCSRTTPLMGVSLLFSLLAYNGPHELALISYLLALFSITTSIVPMLIATSGNIAASLKSDSERQHFFPAAFTVALGLSALTLALCFIVFLASSGFPGVARLGTEDFLSVSLIYFLSTPFISVNFFMQLFHEAHGKSAAVSTTKIISTLTGVTFLLLTFFLDTQGHFKYYAAFYFFITELTTFLFLIKMSRGYRFFSPLHAKALSKNILSKGLPIAAGVAGQKIYFYLMIEKLTHTDTLLSAKLAIFMSIASILSIPSQSFSQIHSLHVSQHPDLSERDYKFGILWAIGLITTIAGGLYLAGDYLFLIYGNGRIAYDLPMHSTTIFFLASNMLLALTMAHLRARNDTAQPQIMINALMLAIVIPMIYTVPWVSQNLINLLLVQGSAILMGALLLHVRISKLHQKTRTTPQPLDLS